MSLVIFVHIFLAIILFFGANALGHYTPSSMKYYAMTTFLETNEAPAFNFAVRVLTPVVYIILLSAFFYSVNLDRFSRNIYLVSIYYVLFRTFFNIAINRARLINWYRSVLYSLSIILISYFVYEKFIKTKKNLLPDFNNVANELWIIIILFLYNFINEIRSSTNSTSARKNNYVFARFKKIREDYRGIVETRTDVIRLQQICYAVIIYEDFNRPRLFRIVEYVNQFFTKKRATLGIMQFSSSTYISDKESVKLGVKLLVDNFYVIKDKFNSRVDEEVSKESLDEYYQRLLIECYNPDEQYSREVLAVADDLNIKFFQIERRLFY